MGTIISSTTILWGDGLAEPRFLHPFELLLSQGFISQPEHVFIDGKLAPLLPPPSPPSPRHSSSYFLIHHGMRTQFSSCRPGRSRAAMIHQAGNTMNVQVMAMAILYATCMTDLKERLGLDSSLAGLLAIQRRRR